MFATAHMLTNAIYEPKKELILENASRTRKEAGELEKRRGWGKGRERDREEQDAKRMGVGQKVIGDFARIL